MRSETMTSAFQIGANAFGQSVRGATKLKDFPVRQQRGIEVSIVHGLVTLFPSRRTNAVKATWKIRPLGIAEINLTVGESAALQGHPRSSRKIGARLNNEGNVRRARNVETEAVLLDPKAGVAGHSSRIP